MKMMEIVYGECGIDYSSIPDGKVLDCNKVKVASDVQSRIIEKIKDFYPDFSELQILLFLLNYGPMVKEELKEGEVVIEENFLKNKKDSNIY